MVSILASDQAAPGLIPSILKNNFKGKKLSMLLRLISRATQTKVDSGLKTLIKTI